MTLNAVLSRALMSFLQDKQPAMIFVRVKTLFPLWELLTQMRQVGLHRSKLAGCSVSAGFGLQQQQSSSALTAHLLPDEA